MEITAAQSEVISDWTVRRMKLLRYLQTSYLLHGITIISTVFTWILGKHTFFLISIKSGGFTIAFFVYLTLYSFSLILFSQLDARSRFQNYKLLKDKFYEFGFQPRVLKTFVYSRCQRDAIAVAASDLNFTSEWRMYIYSLGFRWYHLLPHLVMRSPKILFSRDYWSKTLFVKTYHSKYFLW